MNSKNLPTVLTIDACIGIGEQISLLARFLGHPILTNYLPYCCFCLYLATLEKDKNKQRGIFQQYVDYCSPLFFVLLGFHILNQSVIFSAAALSPQHWTVLVTWMPSEKKEIQSLNFN